MSDLKSKEQRVKEAITLLKKLPDIGIQREDYMFRYIQGFMSKWVSDGQCITETIEFRSHIGTLILPDKANKVAALDLKAKKSPNPEEEDDD